MVQPAIALVWQPMPKKVAFSKFRPVQPTHASVVPNTRQFWSIQPCDEPVGLFIAKTRNQDIFRHFPYAVAKMYAMATQHKFVFYFGQCPFLSRFAQEEDNPWRHQ